MQEYLFTALSYKTSKITFLIDEEAVRATGTPITWLDYDVWKKGPVSTDVYFSKFPNTNKFEDFVSFEERSKKFLVVKKKFFDDNYFSDVDIEIIDHVLSLYGSKTSDELIEISHKDGSLWSRIVEEKKSVSLLKIVPQTKVLIFLN